MSSLLIQINKSLRKLLVKVRLSKYANAVFENTKTRPDLRNPIDPALEKKHRKYWSGLYKHINPSFIRYYVNASNIKDHRYVGEDIYRAIIDRILNHPDYANFEGNKNYFERYLNRDLFPKVFLRKDLGSFLDRDYNFISRTAAEQIFITIKNDLIVKSAESLGGESIKLIRYQNGEYIDQDKTVRFHDLDRQYSDNYIIQEVVSQHEFFAQFHRPSLNTLRIITYRSVIDNTVKILRVYLKMGTDAMNIDNTAAGGVCCFVSPDGKLDDHAIAYDSSISLNHPNSGVAFKGLTIPYYDRIIEIIKKTASKIPTQRIIAFDVSLDTNNAVIIIENNFVGAAAAWAQVRGGPLFGEYTGEVLNYCIKNKHKDDFRVLRV